MKALRIRVCQRGHANCTTVNQKLPQRILVWLQDCSNLKVGVVALPKTTLKSCRASKSLIRANAWSLRFVQVWQCCWHLVQPRSSSECLCKTRLWPGPAAPSLVRIRTPPPLSPRLWDRKQRKDTVAGHDCKSRCGATLVLVRLLSP